MNRSIASLFVLLFIACRCVLAGGGDYFDFPVPVAAVAKAEITLYKNPPTEGYLFYSQATGEISKLPAGTKVKVLGVTRLKTLKGSQVWAQIQVQTPTAGSGWIYVADENAKTATLQLPDGSELKLNR